MSGLTFASTYAENRHTPNYFLRDVLYPTQSEIAIQVGDGQADRENRDNAEDRVCNQCGCDRRLIEKGMLEHYLESATIHGMAQTTGPHFYNYRRPLWLVLILGMAVMLGWTLFQEMSNLNEYPSRTVTRVSLKDEVTFPAVTICNLNQYYIDRVPNIPIVKMLFTFQSDYAALTLNQAVLQNLSGQLYNMSDVSGDELRKIIRHAAPRLNELLVRCNWSFRNYNCSDLFRPMHTGYGTCFVFNGPDVPPEQRGKVHGTMSKLQVTSVIDNERSYFSTLIHAGLKVIVHEADHSAFPLFQGSYVRPGVAALMAISKSESKGLPKPYKAYRNNYCVDTKAADFVHNLTFFKTYNRVHCLNDCILKAMFKLCGCHHHFAVIGDGKPLCTAKQLLTCYLPKAYKLQSSAAGHCVCPMECHSVTYSADVSYANIASTFIEQQAVQDGITVLSGDLSQNVVDISINFKTLNIMENEQEPTITLSSILGRLGGQMGLFLGASILSITELVEFFLLWSVAKVKLLSSWVRGHFSVHPSSCNLRD